MVTKKDEKHLTVSTETFKKLRVIAKREDRTYKAVITRLIEKEFKKWVTRKDDDTE